MKPTDPNDFHWGVSDSDGKINLPYDLAARFWAASLFLELQNIHIEKPDILGLGASIDTGSKDTALATYNRISERIQERNDEAPKPEKLAAYWVAAIGSIVAVELTLKPPKEPKP